MSYVVHRKVLDAILDSDEYLDAEQQLGDAIAEDARQLAPKDSGDGARSIHAERVDGQMRVSWDQEHWYMGWRETGTEEAPAHPFLRPAAYKHQ